MLKIRQEQVEALRLDRLERFIVEVAARAAARHPEDAHAETRARQAVERSLAAGIDGERDVMVFVDLSFAAAPRFDEEWVRELLAHASLSGPTKIELLRAGIGGKAGR